MRRWEQVWELWQEGWSVSQIAYRLGIDRYHCAEELRIAQTYDARAKAKSAWERQAEALAEFYSDERAKAWVYRQMGVEERRR